MQSVMPARRRESLDSKPHDTNFDERRRRVLNHAQYIVARSHNLKNLESAVQDEIEVRQYGTAAIATGRYILHGTQ